MVKWLKYFDDKKTQNTLILLDSVFVLQPVEICLDPNSDSSSPQGHMPPPFKSNLYFNLFHKYIEISLILTLI